MSELRILHTSDWHLGQKFLFRDREEEHRMALNWLRQTMIEENIDILIVTGDIFDIGNPPNYARQLYYSFLTGLMGSCCRHVVIIGGNHDSPSMLDAPRDLLRHLKVYVVGSASEDLGEEILQLKDHNGQLEAVVAAVPFLRDRDIRNSLPGETNLERIERIKQGIYNHYAQIGQLAGAFQDEQAPLIATGHLYAKGAKAAESQDNIYIGNRENMEGKQFPKVFDFVALGHLHRAQMVGRLPHIWYSGSLIPLSFSEVEDQKVVLILQFQEGALQGRPRSVEVPVFRQLRTLRGKPGQIRAQLEKLADTVQENDLHPWVEVIVESKHAIPNLDGELRDFIEELPLELLKVRIERQGSGKKTADEEVKDLETLTELEVFRKRCVSAGIEDGEMEELEDSFKALINWMEEKEFE